MSILVSDLTTLWDTVNRLPHGVRINDTILHWGLTQEMTRREMKFALEVEQVLNRIAEPEYREMEGERFTVKLDCTREYAGEKRKKKVGLKKEREESPHTY
ncbi:hypothetical protein COOONC_27947 [Cooperia oncophora]